MSTAVVSLEATATAQATKIARLETSVATAASESADFCRGITINGDDEFERLAPHLRSCTAMAGPLILQYVSNASAIAEAFQNLRVVTGDGTNSRGSHGGHSDECQGLCGRGAIRIRDCGITTFDGAFPVLASAGSIDFFNNAALVTLERAFPSLVAVTDGPIQIYNNVALINLEQAFPSLVAVTGTTSVSILISGNQEDPTPPTIDGAFPALRTVSGYISIQEFPYLETFGTAFPLLETVPDLRINDNNRLISVGASFGRLRNVVNSPGLGMLSFRQNGMRFCQNARAILCPLTGVYSPYGDANDCCTAYCGANRVNC